MDVTWAGGEGFVISYLDAHMFQEVNLQTASGSAESAKGGLITNMVTKTGSNRFLGSYNFTGGGENTSWDNLSGQDAHRPAGGGAAARAGGQSRSGAERQDARDLRQLSVGLRADRPGQAVVRGHRVDRDAGSVPGRARTTLTDRAPRTRT